MVNLAENSGRIAISAFALAVLASTGVRWSSAQIGDVPELPHAFPRDGATMILDNTMGTAWDVTWVPGKPTPMHRHTFDYVGVELADTSVDLIALDGTRRTTVLTVGHSYFLPRGTTHIEEVPGMSPVRHAVIIDLKDPVAPRPVDSAAAALSMAAAKKVVENDRVVMWDFTWPPAKPVATVAMPKGAFIVFLEGGELASGGLAGKPSSEVVTSGEVLFSGDGRVLSEVSAEGRVRGIVVQLK
jgi:hypothetical protein